MCMENWKRLQNTSGERLLVPLYSRSNGVSAASITPFGW